MVLHDVVAADWPVEAVVGLVEVSEHQEERENPLPVTALDPPAVQEGGVHLPPVVASAVSISCEWSPHVYEQLTETLAVLCKKVVP